MGFLNKFPIMLLIASVPSLSHSQESDDNQYERSSLHTMMIYHPNSRFAKSVEETFMNTPFPERFNNHDLGVKKISFAESVEDQTYNLNTFIEKVNLGQKMIAKWFNRNKQTGSFNMNLIKQRGQYNATTSQINEARANIRGLSLIEDAGENLIKNTYLLVNDIDYQSKGTSLGFLKAMGAAYVGSSKGMMDMFNVGGFNVVVTSYLFRLKWDDDIANTFYKECYTEDGTTDKQKVETFKQMTFKMEFIGKTLSSSTETHLSSAKDPAALLVKIMTRTIDYNLAQLQHTYPDFRIKAPLMMNDGQLTAYIGKKEDVREDSQFEVLERIQGEDGKISYKRVGIIKPISGKIWDNRFMASEDKESSSELSFTTFTKISGKEFFPGMLIREIK